MQRIVEPELMTTEEQVSAYDTATPRQFAIKEIIELYKKYTNFTEGTIVDLGCGTADYLVTLQQEFPKLNITGYDGSQPMIDVALKNISGTDIKVICSTFDTITTTADCAISTNTLHHVHEPLMFWKTITNISNKIFVLDLVRPENITIAQTIVETMAPHEPTIFKKDFLNSLRAAFTKEELEEQVKNLGLTVAIEGSDGFLQIAIIYGEVNESI